MKKQLITIILILSSFISVPAQMAAQDENATLRDALKQALGKLDYYKNLSEKADSAIEAQKKTITDAKAVIASDKSERAAMQTVIDNAEKVIENLQSIKTELDKQIAKYQEKKASLEKQLAREKSKTSFYRKLFVFGTGAGVIAGIIIALKVEQK